MLDDDLVGGSQAQAAPNRHRTALTVVIAGIHGEERLLEIAAAEAVDMTIDVIEAVTSWGRTAG